MRSPKFSIDFTVWNQKLIVKPADYNMIFTIILKKANLSITQIASIIGDLHQDIQERKRKRSLINP